MIDRGLFKCCVGILCLTLTTAAYAHTGHGVTGFLSGLAHPFGLDHLLAMFAVGFWSFRAMSANEVWVGPLSFMVLLFVGACLGVLGVTLPYLELLIAISVMVFGGAILFTRFGLPSWIGLCLIGAGAFFHGLAHGSESMGADFGAYALGFLLATAVLHSAGVLGGIAIRRQSLAQIQYFNSAVGSLISAAGLWFIFQA